MSRHYRRRLAKGFEGFLQLLVNDVGVDLRGGQIGMAQRLLDRNGSSPSQDRDPWQSCAATCAGGCPW